MKLSRRFLLQAAKSRWLREHAPRYGFFRRTSERFLPGETPEQALAAARSLAASGVGAILTHLGENITDAAQAEAVAAHYLGVLDLIRSSGSEAELSVKLTQLGIDFDRDLCLAHVNTIASRMPQDKLLWIDMESAAYTDLAIDIFRCARANHPNIGICVQAYLYRTEQDVARLIEMGAPIRLVKGAYNEPSEIAFPWKPDVDENFFVLAQALLSPAARRAGVRAAIGTHDRALIERILSWAVQQGIARDRLEFQMLYGIQRAEQIRLASHGYRSAVLINYGTHWFPWFMRRMAERPANVMFLARNLFAR